MAEPEITCVAQPIMAAITHNQSPSPTDHQFMFSIDFYAETSFYAIDKDGDQREVNSSIKEVTRNIERYKLLDNNTNRVELETILAELDVPDGPFVVISKILDCAREMICQDTFGNQKIWPMKVTIWNDMIVAGYEYMDEDEEEESMQMVPTIVSEDSMNKECLVCLEELLLGSEATSLPCSHLFHGDCIIKWVHQKNTCPTCRSDIVKEQYY
ncbi:hypothetical protein ACFE04_006133 [Oxalis oulophora]